MKKVIDGHMYNTETAVRLGHYESPYPCNDFSYYEETLYRNRAGYYFLYGNGNAGSLYSKECGQNVRSGDERIYALSEAKAKEWAETRLDGDEYEQIFGCMDTGITGMMIHLPDDILSQVDAAASRAGQPREDFIIAAVREKLAKGGI